MFEGLLGASMAAADAGSSLEIQLVELDEQTVEIVYCDEGRPMSDTIKRHLFGRDGATDSAGAHAEAARDSIEGLALCSMIVEAHGGTMHAENRGHSGRRFRIHLPR
jgi:signal transduction histidine kinase